MLVEIAISGPVLATLTRTASWLAKDLVLFWLALWVLALPLFHVHTQAENQRGVPHSVFSADLPGEYGPRSSNDGFDRREARQSDDVGRLSSGSSFPELAFTAPVPARDLDCKYQTINEVQKYPGCDLIRLSTAHAESDECERNQWEYYHVRDPRGPPHAFSRTPKLTRQSACIGG